ncbi:ATP-binding protein, partial [Klebsiella pneumoniae]
KRAYCLKIQPATGSFARNLIYSTKPLVIENPGKPIPEEHLSRLFDRFYRVDPSRQRKGEGSGIGLAIVKSIVEAHHGRVQVESDVRSTRFILSVPRLEKMIPETQC